MGVNTIDANMLKNMFLAGAKRIEAKKEWINELNVFPVPDGDTGTNMTMTIMSAAREVSALTNPDMESLSKAISQGALRGARGNSGVILSQLFRGFTRPIKDEKVIDSVIAAEAFKKASETAYKAVMKPKEGTILTVARGMAEKAADVFDTTDDLAEGLRQIIEYGDYMLSLTPEMLPVLKQAGVVDSGGQGLMTVLKGAYDCLMGIETVDGFVAEVKSTAPAGNAGKMGLDEIETANIRFGYCTEFIVMLEKPFDEKDEEEFKTFLSSIGDSIVCVADSDIVKVHVHTNDPGLAIQKGLSYGSLTSMKIDNMREEHHERLFKDAQKLASAQAQTQRAAEAEPEKEIGFVAVSMGDGMKKIFSELGVDEIIEGGQTMNPSTADILDAVERVNAKTVFVLPNNKNIILAAQQARELVEGKKVIVIPSKTVPQGITAVINYINGSSAEENEAAMNEEMQRVKSGQITYAVRDTVIDDKTIKEGDIMGLGDDGLLAVGENIEDTTLETIAALVDEDSEIISLYYGEDVSEEDAENLTEKLEEKYPDCEVELNQGGQPIYYYVVSVE
ncbi:MAG: DAK2 domain-containing protein [Coprococcus sp.]